MKNFNDIQQQIKQTNNRTEKANQRRAAKFYREILIPKIESKIGSKCIDIQWYEYDGPGGKQSMGIDGCFQFENGLVLNFQEKTHLNNTLNSTTRWSTVSDDKCHAIEIVNHGGGIGWVGHTKNVNFLFIFYKDYVVIVGNKDLSTLTTISSHGEEIYKFWDKSGRPEKQQIVFKGVTYRLNSVSEEGTTSKTIITNFPESVITNQLKCSIKTYKA